MQAPVVQSGSSVAARDLKNGGDDPPPGCVRGACAAAATKVAAANMASTAAGVRATVESVTVCASAVLAPSFLVHQSVARCRHAACPWHPTLPVHHALMPPTHWHWHWQSALTTAQTSKATADAAVATAQREWNEAKTALDNATPETRKTLLAAFKVREAGVHDRVGEGKDRGGGWNSVWSGEGRDGGVAVHGRPVGEEMGCGFPSCWSTY